MKNKTLTLLLSVILIASFFTACSKTIESTSVSNSKVKEITPLKLDDINYDDLNTSIKKSVLATSERLSASELTTTGHILLGAEIQGSSLIAYTIAGVNNFGFQNGILTSVSATGAIPTVIKYEINPDNKRYTEIEYLEPNSDADFKSEIIRLFPAEYVESALNADSKYPEIEKMQVKEALDYLDFIKREAKVKTYIEKDDIKIIDENILLEKANKYPTWYGSLELVEDGERYLYKSEANNDTSVIFTKENSKHEVLEKFSIDSDGLIINLLSSDTEDYHIIE